MVQESEGPEYSLITGGLVPGKQISEEADGMHCQSRQYMLNT